MSAPVPMMARAEIVKFARVAYRNVGLTIALRTVKGRMAANPCERLFGPRLGEEERSVCWRERPWRWRTKYLMRVPDLPDDACDACRRNERRYVARQRIRHKLMGVRSYQTRAFKALVKARHA